MLSLVMLQTDDAADLAFHVGGNKIDDSLLTEQVTKEAVLISQKL